MSKQERTMTVSSDEMMKTIREHAKKVYPTALKEVDAVKYKISGLSGYYLLDAPYEDKSGNIPEREGKIPNLFYRNKWREDYESVACIYEWLMSSPMTSSSCTNGIDTDNIDLSQNPEMLGSVLAKSAEEAVCVCTYCELVFKQRPYICQCRSNVFLKNL